MDVPVSLGIVLAFVASVWNALRGQGEVYFDSVTMFVFFLGLGRYIEMIARHRAGSVADALARLAPVTARRLRGGQAEDVQAVELAVGDELLVRTGEVFAADGVVIEGDGRVDESMLTGESAAIAKPPGAPVHQGTQNLAAPLKVQGGCSRGPHRAVRHRGAARARAGRTAAAREGCRSRRRVVPEPHPGRRRDRVRGLVGTSIRRGRSPRRWPCWSSPAPARCRSRRPRRSPPPRPRWPGVACSSPIPTRSRRCRRRRTCCGTRPAR